MKWLTWSMTALPAISFAGAGCDDDDDNNSFDWNQSDKDFVVKANEANYAEIDAGTLASDKGQHDTVKMFGHHMIVEHQPALDELKSMADGNGVELKNTLNAEHRQLKQRLMTLSGYAFDTVYMTSQVKR